MVPWRHQGSVHTYVAFEQHEIQIHLTHLADVSRYENTDFLPLKGTDRMEVPEGGFLIKIYKSPLEVTISVSKGCRK